MLKKIGIITLVSLFAFTLVGCKGETKYGEIKEVEDDVANIENDYLKPTEMDKYITFNKKVDSTEANSFIENINIQFQKEYPEYDVLIKRDVNEKEVAILTGDNVFYFGVDKELVVNYIYRTYSLYDTDANFDKDAEGKKVANVVAMLCYSGIENITKQELSDIHASVMKFIKESKEQDTFEFSRKRWDIKLIRDKNKIDIDMTKK